jgi:CTD nuclear envelope phosphatase 1
VLNFFVSQVSEWFDLAVYTASVDTYAMPVLDFLECGRDIFRTKLFREVRSVLLITAAKGRSNYGTEADLKACASCSEKSGYLKDLSLIGQNLSRIILLDNSPLSFTKQPGEYKVCLISFTSSILN